MVRQRRIEDRRPAGQRDIFDRKIVPPYLRRTQSLDEAIAWMYLYGISTHDLAKSLEALRGPVAKGVSPMTVAQLVDSWKPEYADWNQCSLAGKQYVDLWADGVYFNIRMEEDWACVLVLRGAMADRGKGKHRHGRRVPGKRTIVVGRVAGYDELGTDHAAEMGHRRWSLGLLGGVGEALSRDSPTAVLGA